MSGIKITYAYDNNGVRVNADTYGTFPISHPLKCPDKNCDALIEHVSGYKRESYGKQQFIPAFYRLEKGFDHNKHCQYKSSGKDTIFAGESGYEVKNALLRGELLFRIHVMDADERKILRGKENNFQQTPPNNTTERKYRRKGKIPTYVKTMSSLLEIYNHGLKNPSDRAKIQLLIGGRIVKWDDFFYSTNHLDRLKKRLYQENIVQAAAIVKVRLIGLPDIHKKGFTFIECSPSKPRKNNPIYTTIQLPKRLPASKFTLNKIIMVLGKFSIPNVSDRVTPQYLGDEIRTLVANEQQLVDV